MNLSPNAALALVLGCLVLLGFLVTVLKPRSPQIQAADRWIFGAGSPTTMGVLRIFVGFLALVNFLMLAVDFDAWFTERGYAPWSAVQRFAGSVWRLNVLAGVYDERITATFYVLLCLSAFLTMIGLWTRPASIALAIGTISLHMRNPIILHGGDTVLRCLVLYVAVAPSGAACSVDRLLALWKGKAAAQPLVSLWPQRFVQFQVAVIYFTTVWCKRFGSHWIDGTATWYPAQMSEFDRFWVPEFLDRQPFLAITTYGTLLVEFALATIVFYRPARKWVLLSGVLLHLGIEYRFNIPLFAFLMIAQYIAFYDGEEVSGWARRVGARLKRLHLRVAMPVGKTLHEDRGAALRAMDAFELITYERGTEPGWVATAASGRRAANPYRAALARSVGGWGTVLVPGLWAKIMDGALCPSASAEGGTPYTHEQANLPFKTPTG
jgi:hypothetical protein